MADPKEGYEVRTEDPPSDPHAHHSPAPPPADPTYAPLSDAPAVSEEAPVKDPHKHHS